MAQSAGLKRGVGHWLLVFCGLGNILGAGIYVLVGKVAGTAVNFSPLSFLMAAIIVGITAFSYAEFSFSYPVWLPVLGAIGALVLPLAQVFLG